MLVQHPCLAPLEQRFDAAMAMLPAVLVRCWCCCLALQDEQQLLGRCALPQSSDNHSMQGCGHEQECNLRIALAGFLGRILFQWKIVIGHAAIDALSEATSERVSTSRCSTARVPPTSCMLAFIFPCALCS